MSYCRQLALVRLLSTHSTILCLENIEVFLSGLLYMYMYCKCMGFWIQNKAIAAFFVWFESVSSVKLV